MAKNFLKEHCNITQKIETRFVSICVCFMWSIVRNILKCICKHSFSYVCIAMGPVRVRFGFGSVKFLGLETKPFIYSKNQTKPFKIYEAI